MQLNYSAALQSMNAQENCQKVKIEREAVFTNALVTCESSFSHSPFTVELHGAKTKIFVRNFLQFAQFCALFFDHFSTTRKLHFHKLRNFFRPEFRLKLIFDTFQNRFHQPRKLLAVSQHQNTGHAVRQLKFSAPFYDLSTDT